VYIRQSYPNSDTRDKGGTNKQNI